MSRARPAQPIYARVEGAPYQPNAVVRVVRSLDSESSQCGVHAFVGCIGRVSYLEYSCGCGQTYPNDPMIGVSFGDGRTEEFWADELEAASS
jgi:hypothetical protein